MSKVEHFQSMANVKARSDAPNMQVMSSGITAIKSKLEEVQSTLANYVVAAKEVATPVAVAAPAPTVTQNQGELDTIIRTVSALTRQVSAICDVASQQPIEEEEEEEVSDFIETPAQTVTVQQQPIFSRTIPIARKIKPLPVAPVPAPVPAAKKIVKKVTKAVVAAAPADEEDEDFPEEEPKFVRFTDAQIKDAHIALDAIIARKYKADSPMDFVIGTEEELYCVRRFRHLMTSRHEEMAKNFVRQFDKLCGKR